MANTIKKWDGSKWVGASAKSLKNGKYELSTIGYWDGTKWIKSSQIQTVVRQVSDSKTYDSTWWQSYDGNSNMRSTTSAYQGRYGHHDTVQNIVHNPIYFGRQRSLFGFNIQAIQKDLAGAEIESVEIYLKNQHTWYVAGGTASIVSHNFSNKPSTFNYVNNVTREKFSKGQGKWITLPKTFGNDLKSGRVTGFGLFIQSDDPEYYGYYETKPKIRVRYKRNYYTLIGPDGQPIETQITTPSVSDELKYITYKVVANDTLWSIAQKYNVSVAQIQSWNNISDASTITIGQTLKIYTSVSNNTVVAPVSTPKYTTVRTGEGLVQVVERLMRQGLLSSDFNQARQTIMLLNGFTTSNPILQPNQIIMYSRT